MIQLRKFRRGVEERRLESERDLKMLRKNRMKRLIGFYYMLVLRTVPQLFSLLFLHTFGLFIPVWRKKAKAKFLMDHARDFFEFRGHIIYPVEPPPEQLPEPSIIFTVRLSDMTSLMCAHQCPFPVIFPVSKGLVDSYRLHPFIPGLTFKSFFKTTSYPDAYLPHNLDRIKGMLNKGYSVIVYLNEYYVDPRFRQLLPVSKAALELLEHPSIYFLSLDGAEYAGEAHFKDPSAVRWNLSPRDEVERVLFDHEKGVPRSTLAAAAGFFGFDDIEWVPW